MSSQWREEKLDSIRAERFYAEFEPQKNAMDPYLQESMRCLTGFT
jgi:hypothetical protein